MTEPTSPEDFEPITSLMVAPDESFAISVESMAAVVEFLKENPPPAEATPVTIKAAMFIILTDAEEYTQEEKLAYAQNPYMHRVIDAVYNAWLEHVNEI